jgi:hypothetical protein
MRNGTDMGLKCVMERMGIKSGTKWSFFSPLFFISVFSIYICFAMECNVVVLIIRNISYTAISIKVVTDTIVKCAIYSIVSAKRTMGIIIVLNKLRYQWPRGGTFSDRSQCK